MAPPNKIINHPDKELLIQRLTAGDSVRSVEAWIADRYPTRAQAHLRLSSSTIQQFRKEFLNISGEVLADISDASSLTKQAMKHEMIVDDVRATGAYKEAITAIATERLDVQRELIEIFHILKSRLEVMFDRVNAQGFSDKMERSLRDLTGQMLDALEKYKKFVEGYTEKTEHSININVMQGQVGIIREAVREVVAELDPDLAVKFMGKLNEKMRALQYRDLTNAPVATAVKSPRIYDTISTPPPFPEHETPAEAQSDD